MKTTFLLLFIFISFVIYSSVKYPSGIVGTTKLNGEGCVCHSSEIDSTVSVWIEGPDTLTTGQAANFIIKMTGGPKIKGGYNVAARFGSLAVVDTFSKIIDLELTHSNSRIFPVNDTLIWDFEYHAPNNAGIDSIYSVGNSINGDDIPTDEDKWNFGENFVVTIVPPVNVKNELNKTLLGFELMQNFPNPFNPSTKIRYTIVTPPQSSPLAKGINEVGFVSLKVYDALGNEVATLVNEYKSAGSYEADFKSPVGSQQIASGIYYYRLDVGNYSETRKMVLTK